MAHKNTTPTDDVATAIKKVPSPAVWLGGLGLIPFVVGALVTLTTEVVWAADLLRFYAASILAFMGGVQWGLAVAPIRSGDHDRLLWRRLSMSVVPALVGWLALLLPADYGLFTMAFAFGALLLVDLKAVEEGWAPNWYRQLRIPLTTLVVVMLVAGGLGTLSPG